MRAEAKVGVFVSLGFVLLFLLSTQINSFSNFSKEGYIVYTTVNDASGLEKNAKVKMNGVNVGQVKAIYLDKTKVVIELFLHEGVFVPTDSMIVLSQESFLGGKLVNIIPGKETTPVKIKGKITKYKNLASFEQTSDSINDAAIEFKALVKEVRQVFDEEGVKDIKKGIKNFQEAAASVRDMVEENRADLNQGLKNFASAAGGIDRLIQENRKNVYDAIENFKNMGSKFGTTADTINERLPSIVANVDDTFANFKSVGKTLDDKLPPALDKFSTIEDKVIDILDENKEPLNNALVSADEFFSTGEEAFAKVDEFLGSITKSELHFSMRSEYQMADEYAKIYVGIAYLPNPHTYYLFDLVTQDDYSRKDANGNLIKPSKNEDSDVLFSAQYGKRYASWLFRAGLIESTGGIGFDYFMFNDDLKLSFDAFDFNAQNDVRNDSAHLKASLQYEVYEHVNIYTGVDNFLNDDVNFFFGIGASFVDDDLKSLLGSASLAK